MISIIKKIYTNLFHLGFIQATNILLQLLLIPLVISRVGLGINGLVLTALSVAGLLSILVNYAGGQTIPVVLSKLNNRDSIQSTHIHEEITANYAIRFFVFLLSSAIISVLYFAGWSFGIYLMCILPLLFSEVLNPHSILLSIGKISYFNYANLFSRTVALWVVWMTLDAVEDAPWVNAWVGLMLLTSFVIVWILLLGRNSIRLGRFNRQLFLSLLMKHGNLVAGNLVVQLQQSVFLYGLGFLASPAVLGAYAVLDKLVSGVRMVLIAFSNAIYPYAISVFNEGTGQWYALRRKVNRFFWILFSLSGLVIYFVAPVLADLLADAQGTILLTTYIRFLSLVPLLISLNALNVLELLMYHRFERQFFISMQLLGISFLMSFLLLMPFYGSFKFISPVLLTPYLPIYIIFIEFITLVLYERNRNRIG